MAIRHYQPRDIFIKYVQQLKYVFDPHKHRILAFGNRHLYWIDWCHAGYQHICDYFHVSLIGDIARRAVGLSERRYRDGDHDPGYPHGDEHGYIDKRVPARSGSV